MFEQFVDATHQVVNLRVFGGQGGLEVAGVLVLGAAVVYYVVRYRFFRLRRGFLGCWSSPYVPSFSSSVLLFF